MSLGRGEFQTVSTQNETPDSSDFPVTSITIYGGKSDEVGSDAKSTLGIAEDEYYGTWLSMGILRRLGFLFEGGVESAGGVGDILCMFTVLVMVLAVFALWSVAVVFAVVLVLTILSGGAAYKFIRAVYITAPISDMGHSQIDQFIVDQLGKGRFVRVEGGVAKDVSETAAKSSSATITFRTGIQFSLFIATVFLITEVIYYLLNSHWLSGLNPAQAAFEIPVLTLFGFLFLFGVILMDVGVYLRRRVAKAIV
jgi:hypothetical protein